MWKNIHIKTHNMGYFQGCPEMDKVTLNSNCNQAYYVNSFFYKSNIDNAYSVNFLQKVTLLHIALNVLCYVMS